MRANQEFHITGIIAPYDFEPALTQYNIYPWIQEGDTLARVLRLKSGKVIKAEITSVGTRAKPRIRVMTKSDRRLTSKDMQEVKADLIWCMKLDVDLRPFYRLCQSDPVLRVALGTYRGGRGKIYPTVLEAIVGVICAQNIYFKRLYSMMYNLARTYGAALKVDGTTYYAFPQCQDLADASEESLRGCKVGYRAKFIRGVAKALVAQGLDPEQLKSLPTEEARRSLLSLPGIGPYTANLVLSVGLRRGDTIHLDSFVREIMWTFYFRGRRVSDEAILDYARQNWAGFESAAISLLTTDTHIWADKLGADFRLKSGARQ